MTNLLVLLLAVAVGSAVEAQGQPVPAVRASKEDMPRLAETVTLKFESASLETVISEFSSASGLSLVAEESALDGAPAISVSLDGAPLAEALDRLIKVSGLVPHPRYEPHGILKPGTIIYLVSPKQARSAKEDDVLMARVLLTTGQGLDGRLSSLGPDSIELEVPFGKLAYRRNLVESVRYHHRTLDQYHKGLGDYWVDRLWDSYLTDEDFTSTLRRAVQEYKKALQLNPGFDEAAKRLAYVEAEEEKWQKKLVERLKVRKAQEELRKAQVEGDVVEDQLETLKRQAETLQKLEKKIGEFELKIAGFEKELYKMEVDVGQVDKTYKKKIEDLEYEMDRFVRRYRLYYYRAPGQP